MSMSPEAKRMTIGWGVLIALALCVGTVANMVRAADQEPGAVWRSACENDCMNCEFDRALGRSGDDRDCKGSVIDNGQ
jgi:hypothetical protein